MRTANEIRATRLREACCSPCAQGKPCAGKKKKVSADQPPKGDGGIEVQTEQVVPVNRFVERAARAIIEGKAQSAVPAPQSKAVSLALAGVRKRLGNVSA